MMEPQTQAFNSAITSSNLDPGQSGKASSLRRLLPLTVRRRSSATAPTVGHTAYPRPGIVATPQAHNSSARLSRVYSVLVESFPRASRWPGADDDRGASHKRMRAPNLGITTQRAVSPRHDTVSCGSHSTATVHEPSHSVVSSPRTPHSPAPTSPFAQILTKGHDLHAHSPVTAILEHHYPKPASKSVKSIFSNSRASRSTSKINKAASPAHQPMDPAAHQEPVNQVYRMNSAMGSSPQLTGSNTNSAETSSLGSAEEIKRRKTELHMQLPSNAKKKSSKHKFLGIGRKPSAKEEENDGPDGKALASQRLKSRCQHDIRQDGATAQKSFAGQPQAVERMTSEDADPHPGFNGHHGLMQHNKRSTGTRAADGFGRAAKGLLGKLSTRSSNSIDSREAQEKAAKGARDEADAQKAFLNKSYKVINLPLEQQTRKTRICKRLEDCKDKTEFWLPAIAYRCIDYLNDKGMAHEGLYRVPGSEREIRNWIWRFDNEHDIDLLTEGELYDVNTISSMFKAWLRDLPDEVFPKTIQHKISTSYPRLNEQQEAPELLKAELSQLPPFNYYLLFAVTAHITMLLNASKENKMTFHNLCVCFMPAMRLDLPCFQWLILDWKNCWRGCSTERDHLEWEYSLLEQAGTEQGTTIEQRERVQQHFDRYPPPGSRHGESLNESSLDGSRYYSSRDVSLERGRLAKNPSSSSHASSRSPAPRPVPSSPLHDPNLDPHARKGSLTPLTSTLDQPGTTHPVLT